MMRYVAGTNLNFEIPLIDGEGASVDATAVEYSLVDEIGNVLIAPTALTGYTPGSDAVLTIPAVHNQLAEGKISSAREIILRCTVGASVIVVSKVYLLEVATGMLLRGVNTLVTNAGADLISSEMVGLNGWLAATRTQKSAALAEAYRRLSKVRLLCYPSLADMSVAEVLGLEARLFSALSMAQVAEADSILSDDPVQSRRRDGLVLETIGEVKQMFKNSKPLELPICRKALDYLSGFATIGSKMVGRA